MAEVYNNKEIAGSSQENNALCGDTCYCEISTPRSTHSTGKDTQISQLVLHHNLHKSSYGNLPQNLQQEEAAHRLHASDISPALWNKNGRCKSSEFHTHNFNGNNTKTFDNAQYGYQPPLRKKGLCCWKASRSATAIIIVLVIVILALAVGLIYFLFKGESKPEIEVATPADPAAPNFSSLANQTEVCGRMPPRYSASPLRYRGQYQQTTFSSPTHTSASVSFNIEHLHPQESSQVDTVAGSADRQRLPTARIYGGTNVVVTQFPWQVSLWAKNTPSDERKILKCGGALIMASWIVTAAHCMESNRNASEWTVYLGISSRSDRYHPRAQTRDVKAIIYHPEYDPNWWYDYDLALMKLTEPAQYSSKVKPICLPSSSQRFAAGTSCYISGWGATKDAEDGVSMSDVLQYAQIEIIAQSTCRRNDWYGGLITDRMLCAGKADGSKDACRGDSGGPLSCNDKERGAWTLAGVVSWGRGCGKPKEPGVYTNMPFFTNWIWETIREDD